MSIYYVSTFIKQHSNVVGDSVITHHPRVFQLEDGDTVHISSNDREQALIDAHYSNTKKAYLPLKKGIEFKILNTWENDASSSGSSIRWKLPKGTIVLD